MATREDDQAQHDHRRTDRDRREEERTRGAGDDVRSIADGEGDEFEDVEGLEEGVDDEGSI